MLHSYAIQLKKVSMTLGAVILEGKFTTHILMSLLQTTSYLKVGNIKPSMDFSIGIYPVYLRVLIFQRKLEFSKSIHF